MSKKEQTFEYYKRDKKGNETDWIIYYASGEIKKYSLWSDVFMDWIPVPLETLESMWPGKIDETELMLSELVASGQAEAGLNDEVDQARDNMSNATSLYSNKGA